MRLWNHGTASDSPRGETWQVPDSSHDGPPCHTCRPRVARWASHRRSKQAYTRIYRHSDERRAATARTTSLRTKLGRRKVIDIYHSLTLSSRTDPASPSFGLQELEIFSSSNAPCRSFDPLPGGRRRPGDSGARHTASSPRPRNSPSSSLPRKGVRCREQPPKVCSARKTPRGP